MEYFRTLLSMNTVARLLVLISLTLSVGYSSNAQTYTGVSSVGISDGANLDAFSRLRVSQPKAIFDGQFQYDLKQLLYDTIKTTHGTITHDVTNRCADIALTGASTGEDVYMQTFEFFRYQPGKSQEILITFNMQGGAANCESYAGYGNQKNGFFFVLNGTSPEFRIISGTDDGNDTIPQASWNIDPLDGTGPSGITADFGKTHILVIDFQALYVGRVRFGFDIGGQIIYVTEIDHANVSEFPYIQTANLPIRVGIKATGSVTHEIQFICCSVISEGGADDTNSYTFVASSGSITAGNDTRTHAISIQPRDTFAGLTNRIKLVIEEISVLVTGNTAVKWEAVLGDNITGASFANVNTTYSTAEYTTSATTSGSYSVIFDGGYVAASTQNKGTVTRATNANFPITLDARGVNRLDGRVSIIVTGLGASSACRVIVKWRETI